MQVAELASVDVVITDSGAPQAVLAELRDAGMEVTVVDPVAE